MASRKALNSSSVKGRNPSYGKIDCKGKLQEKWFILSHSCWSVMMRKSRKHKLEATGYIHSQEKKSYASSIFSCLICRTHIWEMGPSVMGGPSYVSKLISLDSPPLRLTSCMILDSVYFCFMAGFGSFLPPCGSQQVLSLTQPPHWSKRLFTMWEFQSFKLFLDNEN